MKRNDENKSWNSFYFYLETLLPHRSQTIEFTRRWIFSFFKLNKEYYREEFKVMKRANLEGKWRVLQCFWLFLLFFLLLRNIVVEVRNSRNKERRVNDEKWTIETIPNSNVWIIFVASGFVFFSWYSDSPQQLHFSDLRAGSWTWWSWAGTGVGATTSTSGTTSDGWITRRSAASTVLSSRRIWAWAIFPIPSTATPAVSTVFFDPDVSYFTLWN